MTHTELWDMLYATQYKLYTNLRVPSRPIIFKMFTKSETMLLVLLLPISLKWYTLYNLCTLCDQSVSKCPNYTKLYKPVGPQPSRNLHHQKQWFEIMSQNFNDGRRNISMIALQFFREQYHCHSVFFLYERHQRYL